MRKEGRETFPGGSKNGRGSLSRKHLFKRKVSTFRLMTQEGHALLSSRI